MLPVLSQGADHSSRQNAKILEFAPGMIGEPEEADAKGTCLGSLHVVSEAAHEKALGIDEHSRARDVRKCLPGVVRLPIPPQRRSPGREPDVLLGTHRNGADRAASRPVPRFPLKQAMSCMIPVRAFTTRATIALLPLMAVAVPSRNQSARSSLPTRTASLERVLRRARREDPRRSTAASWRGCASTSRPTL